MVSTTVTVAVLGLGEAGGAISADLVATEATVKAYDPKVSAVAPLIGAASEAEAVGGADLVLSVNSSADAVDALRSGLPAVKPGAVWADLNTASPEKKQTLRDIAGRSGVAFADVAIMAPVPGRGLRVPMLASGAAAAEVATILGGFGASVEVLDGDAGLAAGRKLLRSVFFKGMSAAVVEALEAARAADCEDWLRDIIIAEFARAGEDTVDRMVTGMRQHAVRRTAEMAAAAEMLTELDVPPTMAVASRDLLSRLADDV
ncbi:MAG: DUF1932 domain-containing protein [Stackebrandtia sp.]